MPSPRKPAAKKPVTKKVPLKTITDNVVEEARANGCGPSPTFDPLPFIQLHAAPNIQVAGDILTKVCFEAAHKAGWWNADNGLDVREMPTEYFRLWVGTKLGLVTTEIAEAIEGFRKNKRDDHIPELSSIEVELADAVIRIADLAGGMGIDLGRAIGMKLHYNSLRADHKPEARAAEGGKKF